jgi:hypothetical protein
VPDILVNYRTADAGFGAAATYELLSVRLGKERLFLDNQSIPPGASYAAEIRRVLESIRVLLVLIGPAWLVEDPESPGRLLIERDDDWVGREIRRAIERGIPVVPVLMDGSALPDPVVLPRDLQPLVLHQSVEVRHHHLGEDVNRLADYLATLISGIAVKRDRKRRPARISTVDAATRAWHCCRPCHWCINPSNTDACLP